MALGKRLINTGAAAACLTDTTDIFGDSSGVALYSLDYDASDESGTYDGTPTDVDFGVGAQINYGARFNGSTSDIVVNNFATLSQVGLSFWVNIADISARKMIIAKYGSGDNREWRINLYDGTLSAILHYNGNNSNSINVTASTYLSNNTWHHFAYSVDGTNPPVFYIDGVSVGTSQFTDATRCAYPNVATPDPIKIGETISSSFTNFEGSFDQIRIFNRAITSDEVSTLFAEEACVYTSTTDIVNYPTGTTPIAYYKLDNSAEDETGSYDGTETDIEYRFGRFGQAAVFNGSTSFIDTNIDTSIGNSYSISLWFNSNSNASTWKQLTGLDNDTYNYTAYISRQANGTLNFIGSDDGSNVTATGTTVTSINQWYHVVAVKDGTTTKLYLDGQEEATGSANATTSWLGSLILGKYFGTTNQSFDGSIDQVRIYDTALTSDQVTELYNEKPEVDTSNFKTVIYDGSNSDLYISNVGFQPDLVWVKRRDGSDSHVLSDSVRDGDGTRLYSLFSDLTAAESTTSNQIKSLDANGFFVFGDRSATNRSGQDYVAWVWKGGGDAVSNTDGSITSQVSANTDAGFSIVKHANSGSTSDTVGHGLSQAPELYITKKYDTTTSWHIYTTVIDGSMDNLRFTTAAKSDVSLGLPTSTVFYNQSGTSDSKNYISYCFHSVSGYSKIGSYSGTGSTGNAITGLGFQPNWLMVKRTDASGGSWLIVDNRRIESNGNLSELFANTTTAESGTGYDIDFTSDGFTLNTTTTNANASGTYNYIYMAIK